MELFKIYDELNQVFKENLIRVMYILRRYIGNFKELINKNKFENICFNQIFRNHYT